MFSPLILSACFKKKVCILVCQYYFFVLFFRSLSFNHSHIWEVFPSALMAQEEFSSLPYIPGSLSLQTATKIAPWQIKSLHSHRKQRAIMRIRLSLCRTEVLPRGQKRRDEDHQLTHYPTLTGSALASKNQTIFFLTVFFFFLKTFLKKRYMNQRVAGARTCSLKFRLWSSNVSLVKLLCVCSAASDSLRPHGLWPARLLCGIFQARNTGVGCHFLLQGI